MTICVSRPQADSFSSRFRVKFLHAENYPVPEFFLELIGNHIYLPQVIIEIPKLKLRKINNKRTGFFGTSKTLGGVLPTFPL